MGGPELLCSNWGKADDYATSFPWRATPFQRSRSAPCPLELGIKTQRRQLFLAAPQDRCLGGSRLTRRTGLSILRRAHSLPQALASASAEMARPSRVTANAFTTALKAFANGLSPAGATRFGRAGDPKNGPRGGDAQDLKAVTVSSMQHRVLPVRCSRLSSWRNERGWPKQKSCVVHPKARILNAMDLTSRSLHGLSPIAICRRPRESVWFLAHL